MTVTDVKIQTEKPLDLASTFVPEASRSKPFGAPVTGSWSNRGVFAGIVSISP
jgi:hypothetical protein